MGKNILVINTGGTIGMVNSDKNNPLSPLRPAKDWQEIAYKHPILNTYSTDYTQINKLIDSSDMAPEQWKEIAEIIYKNYQKYKGFVILHGTDTMAFTSSALSFMLKNLSKPVVLTGSQVPLQEQRTDALQNLISAIEVADYETFGHPLIPEVCICFRDSVIRGNRARKLDTNSYSGFKSPNYSPLATMGAEFIFNKKFIKSKPKKSEEFHINTDLNPNIMVIELFPGFNPSVLKTIFDSNKDIKGLILKTFGNGNAPSSDKFFQVLHEIASSGVIIVNITQCPTGMVKLGRYQASSGLIDSGVITGIDLTPEAAVTKLMYLLGKNIPTSEVKKMMQKDLAGEQTLNHFQMVFNEGFDTSKNLCSHIKIPGEVIFDKLKSATLHMKKIDIKDENVKKLEIKFFINMSEASFETSAESEKCLAYIQKDLITDEGERISNHHDINLITDISDKVKSLLKVGNVASLYVYSNVDITCKEMNFGILTSVE